MLEDMQDILFSATRRNRAWVASKAILFLRERNANEEKFKDNMANLTAWVRLWGCNSIQEQANHLPKQAQELTQRKLKGNQELCFVQQWESLFTDVTFNNHLNIKTDLPSAARAITCNTKCKTGDLMDLYLQNTRMGLTGSLLGNLDRMLHTSSFLVSKKEYLYTS